MPPFSIAFLIEQSPSVKRMIPEAVASPTLAGFTLLSTNAASGLPTLSVSGDGALHGPVNTHPVIARPRPAIAAPIMSFFIFLFPSFCFSLSLSERFRSAKFSLNYTINWHFFQYINSISLFRQSMINSFILKKVVQNVPPFKES